MPYNSLCKQIHARIIVSKIAIDVYHWNGIPRSRKYIFPRLLVLIVFSVKGYLRLSERVRAVCVGSVSEHMRKLARCTCFSLAFLSRQLYVVRLVRIALECHIGVIMHLLWQLIKSYLSLSLSRPSFVTWFRVVSTIDRLVSWSSSSDMLQRSTFNTTIEQK